MKDGDALEDPSLAEFCEAYTLGPACLFGTKEAPILRARNSRFTSAHEVALTESFSTAVPDGAQTAQSESAGVVWSHTYMRGGKYILSLGRSASNGKVPALERRPTHAARTLSAASRIAERWFERWSKLVVPGLKEEHARAHLDLIRNTDWNKTPLGPVDSWSHALLSALGQCLGSPYPVLLAWGPELTMIYNYAYSRNIAEKHPRIMGMAYREAWGEVWDLLEPATSSALSGTAVYAENIQLFLQRDGFLEETHFTWGMIPAFDESEKIVGIIIPNFETTAAITTERRIRLLREASQAFSINTDPTALFRKVCQAVDKQPVDLPLLAFYSSSAADEERESFEGSSQEASYRQGDGGSSEAERAPSMRPDDVNMSDPNAANAGTVEDLEQVKVGVAFVRAATAGIATGSTLFPLELPAEQEGEDAVQLGTYKTFLNVFRQVQREHREVVLYKHDIGEYTGALDKTVLGDSITGLVFLPILTMDGALRAIAIIGLNPRKAYNDDYQVFLDLFIAQISHGITSIRLVNEEIRRSRFFAALIKRKNEELSSLLEARTNELRSSELKFLRMTEISPMGIWSATTDGNISFCNKAWWEISQHPRERGANTYLESVHPDDREKSIEVWEMALRSKQSIDPFEFRWLRRPEDKTDRWAYATSCPELNDAGDIVAITGAIMDVTHRKMLEAHQIQRAEEAIELRRSQEAFVDMTSHELRNPLSAIILSADSSAERLEAVLQNSATGLLAAYKTDIDDTLQDLKIISHCTVHMSRLIDDVLTLSKLDQQFLVITPIPSQPARFIPETLLVFKGELQSKNIECELDIKPAFRELNVDWLLTDPSRVNQLLINLLTNAIKFTAPAAVRKITVTIDVSPVQPVLAGSTMDSTSTAPTPTGVASEPEGDPDMLYLSVSVKDTGRGLTKDEVSGLFQRFKQANPRTHISYGGSGLGLFICRRIAVLLGGEISVESERGKGSTFTFYVPAKRCSGPSSGSSNGQSPGLATLVDPFTDSTTWSSAAIDEPVSPMRRKPPRVPENIRVLIVEDNVINQKLLEKHLTRNGCICGVANHGQEAIDILKKSRWIAGEDGQHWDCVLMDIEMPVLDGLSTIKILRRMQADGEIRGHLPVLAVSANAREEQIQAMLKAGFDGTLAKPFKIPVIMERMKSLLQTG